MPGGPGAWCIWADRTAVPGGGRSHQQKQLQPEPNAMQKQLVGHVPPHVGCEELSQTPAVALWAGAHSIFDAPIVMERVPNWSATVNVAAFFGHLSL